MSELRKVSTHSVSGYQRGCSCDMCRKAWREYHRKWMLAHPEQIEKHAARERARYARRKASNTDTKPISQ